MRLVGYGMPPRHTRFMKGQSGNARGRPNGSKNLPTLLSETLNEPVIVAENGRRRKRSASAGRSSHSLSTDRPRADLRALKILLDILQEIERRTEPASPETSSFSEADKKVIAQLESRLQGKK
jgi:hypothetical protein